MSGEQALSAADHNAATSAGEMDSPPRIWHNRNFLYLWSGQSVSLVGSAVSYIALPLVGVIILKLNAFEVGALASAGAFPSAVLSPFVGSIVDKLPKRLLCIMCDIARGILMGSVPAAAVIGVLAYWQLLVVNAAMGVLTLLFLVAHQALLPEVVPESLLNNGNGKLEASQAAADVTGSGIAAWIMGVAGPAIAIVVDAASYCISAWLLLRMKLPALDRMAERPPERPLASLTTHQGFA